MPFPRPRPASRPVNRDVRIIKFDPHQSTEFDQRSTSAGPSNLCNLESAVRPHMNAILYSITHSTNLYDKMLTNYSSSSNDPVIS